MESYTIKKEIKILASPSVVFDNLTSSEEIIKYFPLKEVISSWKEGSEILYKGEINNQAFTDYGKIDVLSRPNTFKYTYWSDNHGTERKPENHLSIKYELECHDNATKLKLEHSNLKNKEMYNMMNDSVWEYLLNNLKTHIESIT